MSAREGREQVARFGNIHLVSVIIHISPKRVSMFDRKEPCYGLSEVFTRMLRARIVVSAPKRETP